MRHPESEHQQAYFKWARMHPLAKWAFAVPNGGARSKVTAAILKAEGVLAGVPDVLVPVPINGYHGLFIEFKHGSNKPSPEQQEFLERMISFGYCCAVVYDWLLAKSLTTDYFMGYVKPSDGVYVLKPDKRVNLLTARQPANRGA